MCWGANRHWLSGGQCPWLGGRRASRSSALSFPMVHTLLSWQVQDKGCRWVAENWGSGDEGFSAGCALGNIWILEAPGMTYRRCIPSPQLGTQAGIGVGNVERALQTWVAMGCDCVSEICGALGRGAKWRVYSALCITTSHLMYRQCRNSHRWYVKGLRPCISAKHHPRRQQDYSVGMWQKQ